MCDCYVNANVNTKKCLINLFHDLVFKLSLHFQYMYSFCKEKNEIVMFSMSVRYCSKYASLDDQWLMFTENFSFLLRLHISGICYVSIDNILNYTFKLNQVKQTKKELRIRQTLTKGNPTLMILNLICCFLTNLQKILVVARYSLKNYYSILMAFKIIKYKLHLKNHSI